MKILPWQLEAKLVTPLQLFGGTAKGKAAAANRVGVHKRSHQLSAANSNRIILAHDREPTAES
jgi:hypothetical protein